MDTQQVIPATSETYAAIPTDTAEGDVIALWLQGRSPATRRAYQRNAERLIAFLAGVPLRAMTLRHLVAFLDSLSADGLAYESRRQIVASVKSLCSFLQKTGYTPFNVGAVLRMPKAQRGEVAGLHTRIIEEYEVALLLNAEPNQRNHALLYLLYRAGLRVSEAVGLSWSDLEPQREGGIIHVFGKGSKDRAVSVPRGVWQEVQALRGDADDAAPVFASRKANQAISTVQAWRIVKAAGKRAGLKAAALLSPHWLRHAHASHALDHGAPIHVVSATLGHASLATTSRYTHKRAEDSSASYLDI
jgi:integrase/recombinase XerD